MDEKAESFRSGIELFPLVNARAVLLYINICCILNATTIPEAVVYRHNETFK